MSRPKFRFCSFLKLFASVLALGVFFFVIHEQFGMSFQTIKVAVVILFACIFVAELIKIRSRRPRQIITNKTEIIEIQQQLEIMLKNESSKNP